jgi:hypothetical protein
MLAPSKALLLETMSVLTLTVNLNPVADALPLVKARIALPFRGLGMLVAKEVAASCSPVQADSCLDWMANRASSCNPPKQ